MSRRDVRQRKVGVIGGGIVGSSVAYFLASDPRFDGSITVFEPDPTYRESSTARSVATIRPLFNLRVNVEMSRFGYEFYSRSAELLAVGGRQPKLELLRGEYCILTSLAGVARLRESYRRQVDAGVMAEYLEPQEASRRLRWLKVGGVGGAVLARTGAGWIDAPATLGALRAKAGSLGVQYVQGRVTEFSRAGARIAAVGVDGHSWMPVDEVVLATGPRAAEVGRWAGVDLPVRSVKRCVFVFASDKPPAGYMNLVDPTFGERGVYSRPYGRNMFMAITSPDPALDVETQNLDVDSGLFEEVVRPALAQRVRGFEDLALLDAWAGHYEMNMFDQNAIIGRHPALPNLILAVGFSGHGVMHAPAVGRGVSELLATGRYQTIDLSPFRIERIAAGDRLDDIQASEHRRGGVAL